MSSEPDDCLTLSWNVLELQARPQPTASGPVSHKMARVQGVQTEWGPRTRASPDNSPAKPLAILDIWQSAEVNVYLYSSGHVSVGRNEAVKM